MSEASIPTKEELKKLPRWACVAFAARCARRVQPLFNDWDREEKHIADIEAAISAAEEAAATATTHADSAAADDVDSAASIAASIAATASNASNAAASNAANVAASASNAASAAAASNRAAANANAPISNSVTAANAAAYTSYATNAVVDAAAAASRAADAAESDTATAVAEAVTAMTRDLELLKEASRQEEWTDDTPVPPEFFGPLWPEGEPEGWPVKEETSEGQELVLEFEVPEGMSDEEAMERISALINKADDLHRAHGGRGLRTKGVEVYGRELVDDPVGVT